MPVDKVTSDGGGGKWTPGKWRVFGDPEDMPGIDATWPDSQAFSIVIYAEPDEDSDYGIRGRDMSEAWANARLIAAAPAMAEALRAILFQVMQGPVLERDACVTQARAALALAEGGEG